ncbi:unnamed protein product [Closterium sp. NIES-53]
MTLRPSSVPLCVPLPPPPESSLLEVPDPESDRARAISPTVSRLLATAVTDPSFESAAASPLVAELLEFTAACRLDYATALVAESASARTPSVGGECALGTDAAMDAEMASWKSKGTYVDEVPPPGANTVDGMWIFRRKGVDYFHTFSPTPKMTTLWVFQHVAAQSDYKLHSLDFRTAFLQGSLHEEIQLRRPHGFTEFFLAGTQWSLRRPVYDLRQVPREWHDTLRTTLAALGFAPATADPSLFLRTDTSLSPFYILVYVDDLISATADSEALTLILQRFGFQFSSPQPTPMSTSHLLSAPPSDESVEPSGPYPELVGCLMYLMTCTRPDLACPLSLLARYVAPGRHRKVHWDVAKRVLRYLCSTSGMGLVLGGRGPAVLTGHADASWVDDSATQQSSQGYTFSLASGFVSWWSTRSSSILSSSREAEIYAGAMAAQELRWLTYLLTDLGEQPLLPPKGGQLRLAYVATRANTADIFTKALPPGDHQRFSTVLGLLALLFLTGLVTTCSQPLCLWGLRRPVCGLRQAPREWHDTLRTTLAALGFTPSPADPSQFLRTDMSLPPFYVLVYVDDLVFATADADALTLLKARRTITLTQSHMVHQVLQRFGFQFSSPQPTPLSTCHSLSAPPSDESVELSGPYRELVGYLMYLMTCTRPDLAYPLSLLARYVAPGRHQKMHWDAAKRVLRYLCSTSGMELVLGGRGPVVLTGHADASWVDDSATQWSSQGYTFSLSSVFVSWRSTRSTSVLSSSCEAEIYAGAMAAEELRWLTYLLTDLGEQLRSPPVLYVDNKAMIALCQELRLEHKTKHIALQYFLARELQQHGQLRLAYVATRANTADIFTKGLPPGDHQRFSTVLVLVPTLPHLLTT